MIVCARPWVAHRHLERAFPLIHRHGKELTLLAGDEKARDAQIGDPVVHVAGEGIFSSIRPLSSKGISAVAQIPFMCWRAWDLASLRRSISFVRSLVGGSIAMKCDRF